MVSARATEGTTELDAYGACAQGCTSCRGITCYAPYISDVLRIFGEGQAFGADGGK
jgi:hypothetical protein